MTAKSPHLENGFLRAALAAEEEAEEGPAQLFDVDDLEPLEALARYGRSNVAFQRLAYAQGIAAAAASADYVACRDTLLPLAQELMGDPEPQIRLAVLQQLPALGHALALRGGADAAAVHVTGALLPAARAAVVSDEDELAAAGVAATAALLSQLPDPARAAAAANDTLRWLEMRGCEDGAAQAVRVLAASAPSWPPAALLERAPALLARWAGDRAFGVREAAAAALGAVAAHLPLAGWAACVAPAVARLARDGNWRVRKAVAMELPRLTELLRAQIAREAPDDAAADDDPHAPVIGAGASGGVNGASSSSLSVTPHNNSGAINIGSVPRASAAASVGGGGSEAGTPSASSSPSPRGGVGGHGRSVSFTQLNHANRHHPQQPKQPVTLLAGSPPPSMAKHPMSAPGAGAGMLQSDDDDEAANGTDAAALGRRTSSSAALAAADVRPGPAVWAALYEALEALTTDASHWVKVGAQAGLGRCLAALPRRMLTPLLLGRYAAMASSSVVVYDISVALACARGLAPLASRLGAPRWPELRPTFGTLAASRDPDVLREVVAALPALTQLLGPRAAAAELLPALLSLLGGQLSAVEPALVPALPALLEELPGHCHAALLRALPALAASHRERCAAWRLRRALASQLGRMATATAPECVVDALWPAALELCADPVAAVRAEAACQVGVLLAALPRLPPEKEAVAEAAGAPPEEAARAGGADGAGASGTEAAAAAGANGNAGSSSSGGSGTRHRHRRRGGSSAAGAAPASDATANGGSVSGSESGSDSGSGSESGSFSDDASSSSGDDDEDHDAAPPRRRVSLPFTGAAAHMLDDDDLVAAVGLDTGGRVFNALAGAPGGHGDDGGGGALLPASCPAEVSLLAGAVDDDDAAAVNGGAAVAANGTADAAAGDAPASSSSSQPSVPPTVPRHHRRRHGHHHQSRRRTCHASAAASAAEQELEVITTEAGRMQIVNTLHPAMRPVGWGPEPNASTTPLPGSSSAAAAAAAAARKRCASAGNLLARGGGGGGGSAGTSGAANAGSGSGGVFGSSSSSRHHSKSTGRLGGGTRTSSPVPHQHQGGGDGDDPAAVRARLVSELISRFGSSASYQHRQLYVMLVLGVVAAHRAAAGAGDGGAGASASAGGDGDGDVAAAKATTTPTRPRDDDGLAPRERSALLEPLGPLGADVVPSVRDSLRCALALLRCGGGASGAPPAGCTRAAAACARVLQGSRAGSGLLAALEGAVAASLGPH